MGKLKQSPPAGDCLKGAGGECKFIFSFFKITPGLLRGSSLVAIQLRRNGLAFVFVFLSCITMTSTFDRVDTNKLRVIGVVFSPKPDVAPGDTITVTAYFGGNKVVSVSDFKLAYNYFWSMSGITFKDPHTITLLTQPKGLPDSAQISFVINPDVFIGRQGLDSVPQHTVDSISRLFSLSKDSLQSVLSISTTQQRDTLGKYIERMTLPTSLLFTAHSENGTDLPIVAGFTIKYHAPLPGVVPPNNNPDITWLAVCKVPSNYAMGFSPYDPTFQGKFTMTYLYNKNNPALCDSNVDIDTGYAYFLAADNEVVRNGASIDSLRDTMTDSKGNFYRETYNYEWFYQNVDMVTDFEDSLMNIDNSTSSYIEMKPAYNTAMKHFRVWVAVYDQIANIWWRPRGMCVRGVKGVFRFSDAYIRKMSQE